MKASGAEGDAAFVSNICSPFLSFVKLRSHSLQYMDATMLLQGGVKPFFDRNFAQ